MTKINAESISEQELRDLSYRDLQEIAKEMDIQANQSTEVLIGEILNEESEGEEVVLVKEPKKEKVEKEITIVKNETKPIEPKNVRVVLKKDHKCHIGGNWYSFKKGKQYNVPENVKIILRKADLLSPL